MDNERLKKMLLLALSSEHGGEALAALNRIRLLLKQDDKDIHWLADKLTGKHGVEPLAGPFTTNTQHEAPPGFAWVEALTTCHFWLPLGVFKLKEEDFLHSLAQQALKSKSWSPSKRQLNWLYDLWRRTMTNT